MNISLASFVPKTKVLGPGSRAVVQFQGCNHHCPGCIAPETWEYTQKIVHSAKNIAAVASKNAIDGLTITGGEPFDQIDALLELLQEFKKLAPDKTIIAFTGYTIKELAKKFGMKSVNVIKLIDMLIDGRYSKMLDNDIGIGSTNQKVYYITDRLKDYDPLTVVRRAEWHRQKDGYLIMGITNRVQKMAENALFGEI